MADGSRARILLNEGIGKGLRPALDQEFGVRLEPTCEIGTDKPGRSFSSVGGSRHAMFPRVDWHQYEKDDFARMMVEVLDLAAAENAFDRLVLVSPPDTLGELRKALGANAQKRVTGEMVKDLTRASPEELAVQLGAVMADGQPRRNPAART